jgi:hypothetical protein
MAYKVTAFKDGQITLAFDGRQVNFPVPIVDGVYTEGPALIALLDSYVANAQAAFAASQAVVSCVANAAAVSSLVEAPSSAQLAEAIKLQRDMLLRTTDFTVIPGSPFTAEQITAFGVYRQALRDLTLQVGFPTTFTWPVPPVILTNARGAATTNVDGSPVAPLRIIW